MIRAARGRNEFGQARSGGGRREGMSRIALMSVIVAAIAAVAIPAAGASGRVLFHNHENFTDSFPDSICGIDGTSVVKGVDNFTVFANPPYDLDVDNFELNQTFTSAATGKSIVIHVAQHFTSNDQPIDNGDGTVTFVQSFTGLPEQVRVLNGPVLFHDVGTVVFTRTFDATTGDFISQTVSGERGPHPDLDSGFTLFCDLVVPALS
jgi:hypothetical protein